MNELDPLFNLTRKQMAAAYSKAGRQFIASTRTLESTAPLVFTAVDTGVIGAVVSGMLVAAAGQELSFFSYGRDQQVPGTGQQALFDDTNIVRAQSTNANEDFAIESFSVTHRSTVINYALANRPTAADARVIEAVSGGPSVFYDPEANLAPGVVHSALNNEDALWAAVQPHLFLRLKWEKREEELGCLDLVTEGGAKSYMRAQGKPSTDDRYTFREGFAWRRDGSDSKFQAIARLARSIVVPYKAARPQGQAAAIGPVSVTLHVKFRVHGIAFGYGSSN
jgi:hypothetical protein